MCALGFGYITWTNYGEVCIIEAIKAGMTNYCCLIGLFEIMDLKKA